MVQPAVRIDSAHAAAMAARALESPVEVGLFESQAPSSAAVRAFLKTPEWAAIRERIMGSGTPPMGRPRTHTELSRLFRWTADGVFSEEPIPADVRKAYLFCAGELDAFARSAGRAAPVSPAAPVAAAPASSSEWVGFGDALRAVQAGAHIARSAWRGGEYVFAQAGYPQGIGINANTARASGRPEGSTGVFRPYLMHCRPPVAGEPPEFEPWVPGNSDLFADDWRVLAR
jgi:hypothetical protein